jgi:hypothetical protein
MEKEVREVEERRDREKHGARDGGSDDALMDTLEDSGDDTMAE